MKDNAYIKKTLDFFQNIDMDLVKNFVVLDEVSSTNEKARELAQNGEGEGTVVIAQIQNKGKGRFERVWESPAGGLYFSIILKPSISSDKISLLPLVAALTVCKTINCYSDLYAKIKWPNDVRLDGKKVAGILLESEVIGNQLDNVILGIGVNVNNDVSFFSKEIGTNATSLLNELQKTIDYYTFLKKLLTIFDTYYTMFLNKKYDVILKEWRQHSDTINKTVRIITPSGGIMGKAYDVDQFGFLLVETDEGDLIKITSGDCVYIES